MVLWEATESTEAGASCRSFVVVRGAAMYDLLWEVVGCKMNDNVVRELITAP